MPVRKERWAGYQYSVGHLDGRPCVLRRGGYLQDGRTMDDRAWHRYLESTSASVADMDDVTDLVDVLNERAEERQTAYLADKAAKELHGK